MQSRREFLKFLSLAVGASLSGCGGSNSGVLGGAIGPAPVSYQFVPLVRSGQSLPQGSSFFGPAVEGEPPFLGGVMINDKRDIVFHAADQTDVRGIYRLAVGDSGATSDIKTVIREGDILPDGTGVDEFSDGELNNSGDFAVQVENAEGIDSLQYCPDGGDFVKVAESFQELSGDAKISGEICECLSLSDDGRLMFVAEYYDDEGEAEGEGLFLMPIGQGGQTQLIVSNNQLLPGTTSAIQTFGVSELYSGGNYLIQGSASPTEGGLSTSDDGSPLTYLVKGRVGEVPQLLAAHPALGATGEGVFRGSIFMCPRMGASGVGTILQTDANKTELWLNSELLLGADAESGGSLSPRGSRIISMFPPVFGPSGLIFLQVYTNDGMEIVLYDGSQFRTLLARGDTLLGKVVEDIMFGALPESVNAQGELVAVVVFEDDETVVMLGVPV